MKKHLAQEYLASQVFPAPTTGAPATGTALNYVQATTLEQALKVDAAGYFLCAAISIADALHGLHDNYYSWATVKLYYSIFYGLRGLLALDGFGCFYSANKPFLIEARPGAVLTKPMGGKKAATTHGMILETYKRLKSSTDVLMSQPIATFHPLDWVIDRRVDANYSGSRFWEPTAPDHFRCISQGTLRRLTGAYLDDGLAYVHDPDHAILAFPLAILVKLKGNLVTSNCYTLGEDEIDYLKGLFFDASGPLPKLLAIF